MDEVILAYVRDYEIDGEWHLWNIYSPYYSDTAIEKEFNQAKIDREFAEDAELSIERWTVWTATD